MSTKKPRRMAFARSVEAAVDGEAPDAARLAKPGWNRTDKGDLNFTKRSPKLVMDAYAERGNPLAWYYEHEDRIPLEKRGGSPMRGVCSAPASVLVVRDTPEGPELWAEHIEWTEEARRQIVTGERRQLSPIWAFDEDTREILGVLNVSLCAEGATHFGTILATKAGSGKVMSNMDDLLQKLMDAIDGKDWELCENLIQEMEAADSGGAMAKMGRMALKAAKDPEDKPADPAPDSAATKKLAAALAASRRPSGDAGVVALSREIEAQRTALADATKRANAAEREAKIGRVEGLIAANRDAFDPALERSHLRRADPDATKEHIAFVKRQREASGTLAASVDTTTQARMPRDAKPRGQDVLDHKGLSDVELAEALKMPGKAQDNINEYAASKDRQSKNRRGVANRGVN